MLRGTPAKSERGVRGSRTWSVLELLAGIQGGTRIAVAVGLLACFGCEGLWAQAAPHKLIVQRSTRAIPHKFTVHPDEATVSVSQTQRFEVTDAQGRPVAVHWNVSGIGCSGLDCGTIDEQGIYRTPSSLPQPRVVTVEAVLVSDPNYSVLTQVRLEDSVTATANATPGQAATGKTQPFTAPEVGRQSLVNAGLPPLPDAVAAAPVVGRRNLATSAGSPPLPNVVAAAPAVGIQLAISAGLLPLPNVIAAAPVIGRQNLATSAGSPPLPNVIAAAPAIGRQNLATSAGLPPFPNVVAAAPVVERQYLAVSSGDAPLPNVVAVVSPTPALVSTGKTQQLTATAVGRPVSGMLVPRPDALPVVPVGTVVPAQHGPVVTYRDGQLAIDAENSTLAAVLESIAEKTGAMIEVPPGTGLERIFEHTGPGPANDVLEQLLNGSPFNFIIVSSPQNPSQPAQVLLSLRGANTDTSTTASVEPKPASNPYLYTPPETPPPTVSSHMDLGALPTEPLSPQARGELMKEKQREILEHFQKQQ